MEGGTTEERESAGSEEDESEDDDYDPEGDDDEELGYDFINDFQEKTKLVKEPRTPVKTPVKNPVKTPVKSALSFRGHSPPVQYPYFMYKFI